jgi:sirohydrochlorin ferrochelatase
LDSTYLLVTHGSRDPHPQICLENLAGWFRQKLASDGDRSPISTVSVGTATLELAPLPLHMQIQQFAEQGLQSGYRRSQIVPLFLLPGVHVRVDIPMEVARAQQALDTSVQIDLRPHLGSHPKVLTLLKQQMATLAVDRWILLAHGSRYRGGNQPVEDLAQRLDMVVAYWSMPPDLESQLTTLAMTSSQVKVIGILPYFLFAGGLMTAIAQTVQWLQQQFPHMLLKLASPLQASPELAELVLDLVEH